VNDNCLCSHQNLYRFPELVIRQDYILGFRSLGANTCPRRLIATVRWASRRLIILVRDIFNPEMFVHIALMFAQLV
jgi:hypothetical protein